MPMTGSQERHAPRARERAQSVGGARRGKGKGRNNCPTPNRKLKAAPPRGVSVSPKKKVRSASESSKSFVLNAQASSFVSVLNAKASSFVPSPVITGMCGPKPSNPMPFEADSRLRARDGSPVPALALLEAGRKSLCTTLHYTTGRRSLSETWARGGDRRDCAFDQLEHIRTERRSNSISVHSKGYNKQPSPGPGSKKKKPYKNRSTMMARSEPSFTHDLLGGGRMSFSDQVHLSDRMSLSRRMSSSTSRMSSRDRSHSTDSTASSLSDARRSLELKLAANQMPTQIDYGNSCKRRSFQFDQLKKWTDTPESTGRRSSSSLCTPSPSSGGSSFLEFRSSRDSRPSTPRVTSIEEDSGEEVEERASMELLDDDWMLSSSGPSIHRVTSIEEEEEEVAWDPATSPFPAPSASGLPGGGGVREVPSSTPSEANPTSAPLCEDFSRVSIHSSNPKSKSAPIPPPTNGLPGDIFRASSADKEPPSQSPVKFEFSKQMGKGGHPRPGGSCYGCGGPDHLVRDCPEKYRRGTQHHLDQPPASYLQENGLELSNQPQPGDPGWSAVEEEERRAEMEWRNRSGRVPPLQTDCHAELRAACVTRAERKWLWETLAPIDH